MAVFFVHGVPDTDRVWRAVVGRLDRSDVLTLRLPGFGRSAPADFAATKGDYVVWLVEQMVAAGAPVNLVGPRLGCAARHPLRRVYPDLVRSWTAGAAPLDSKYVWHKAAQLWQTPTVGEQAMAKLAAETLADALTTAGVPADDARATSERVDDTMKRCILTLYRSAIHVGTEWGPDLHAAAGARARSVGRARSLRPADVGRAPGPAHRRPLRPIRWLLALVAARAAGRGGRRAHRALARLATAAGDGERVAGDVAGLLGGEEQHGVGHLDRKAEAAQRRHAIGAVLHRLVELFSPRPPARCRSGRAPPR